MMIRNGQIQSAIVGIKTNVKRAVTTDWEGPRSNPRWAPELLRLALDHNK